MTENAFKTFMLSIGIAFLGFITQILIIFIISFPTTFVLIGIATYFPSLFDPLRSTPFYNLWLLSFLLVTLVVLFNKAIVWTGQVKENK